MRVVAIALIALGLSLLAWGMQWAWPDLRRELSWGYGLLGVLAGVTAFVVAPQTARARSAVARVALASCAVTALVVVVLGTVIALSTTP